MNHSVVREIVKEEWKNLWDTKHYDPIVCETVSIRKYAWLDVEEGQVLKTNKKNMIQDFADILEKNYDINNISKPDPQVGGWRKFARESFPNKKPKHEKPVIKRDLNQQKRNHGKGWLNKSRYWQKSREKP